jgi:TonB family protein
VAFFWPAPDVADTAEERRCIVAASILAERVRERLREDLGATYTPSAQFVRHEAFPGFSYFAVMADVSPAQVNQAAQIVAQEIGALRSKGVNADTFARVLQPYLRAREDDLRTNAYWLYTVLSDVQQHPLRLANARNRAADNAAITRDEIDGLLRRYFNSDGVFVFNTYPAAGAEGRVVVGPQRKAIPNKPPQPIRQDKPVYPSSLLLKKIAGTATVEFVVGADGRILRAKAIKASHADFGRAAEEAVLKWQFVPGEKDGKKINTVMKVDLSFDLDKDGKK